MQKLISILLMACFFAVSGAAVATSDITQQKDNPVDCKKTPKDPRCKDR